MQLIKKIISWLISLFRMVFKKNKSKEKEVTQKKDSSLKKNNQAKGIVSEFNENIPSYMYLSDSEKQELINRIKEIKKLFKNRGNDYLNKEIEEIIKQIDIYIKKDDLKLQEITDNFKKELSKGINNNTNKQFDLLVGYLPKDVKEDISSKYQVIYDDNSLIKENITKIERIINTLEKKEITLIEKKHFNEITDDFENSKSKDLLEDINSYNKDMLYVMENINKYIIDKVKLEYKKVNYITLSTELLDEIQQSLKKIEDNYNSHRYNKYYYEREISKIKRQILELKDLKNKPQVYNEILKLRKELYTKSKDKYDILYNNEIFMSINQTCDELLNKVNAKVVDIKKEKKDDFKKENEYLKNIILRFQDMNLARKIIMEMENDSFKNDKEMIFYIKNMLDGYVDDINIPFNFERNKEKTELVVLFNKLNKVNSHLKKEQYVPIEHINFRMNDLLDAVVVRKEELSSTMKDKYNIDITNQSVDEKINNLLSKNNYKKLVKKGKNIE